LSHSYKKKIFIVLSLLPATPRRREEMKKVLCATDHSELSQRAEVFAANLAKAFAAELIYAYVSQITGEEMELEAMRSSLAILKDVPLREHQVLSHAREVADEVGIPEAQYVLLRSHKIASTLINYAKEKEFDHIVVGSAGRPGFPRLMLGSIAGKIVEEAPCPVTVVR
jgi:nucleotide-binding universal stress UspA family protein